MKKISDSYLYQVADYNKKIFEYLMSAERVDKNADGFTNVVYAVKKQANAILMKVLLSDKVVLMIDPNNKGVSRPFKVIYVKDVKDRKQKRSEEKLKECLTLCGKLFLSKHKYLMSIKMLSKRFIQI